MCYVFNDDMETLFIEIVFSEIRNIIVGINYTPHD